MGGRGVKAILGLGNPGAKYARTRHNVGFRVLDELARRHGGAFRRSLRTPWQACRVRMGAEEVLLVKPQTFMNRSGAVVPALKRKGVAPTELVVVTDDADLPLGRLRVRARGSAGGHKGLESLIACAGTDRFVRVRVGIGRPREADLVEHVLTAFGPEEEAVVEETVRRAADAVECVLREGVERAMNRFN